MVGTSGGTHGEEEPTALQVGQFRQLLEKFAFLLHALRRPCSHELGVSDGSTQDHQASLRRWLVPSPHRGPQLGDAGRRGGLSQRERPGFAEVGSDATVGLDWRALESSPALTLVHAASRLRSASVSASSCRGGVPWMREAARRAEPSRLIHSPRWNDAARDRSSFRPRAANSVRGVSKKSFHARDAAMGSDMGPVAESRMRLNAVTGAVRTADRMKGGACCSVGTGHRSSAIMSAPSREAHADSGMPDPACGAASRKGVSAGETETPSSPSLCGGEVGLSRARRRRARRRLRRAVEERSPRSGGRRACRASSANARAAAAALACSGASMRFEQRGLSRGSEVAVRAHAQQ